MLPFSYSFLPFKGLPRLSAQHSSWRTSLRIIPGLDEWFRVFVLEIGCPSVDVNASFPELCQHLLAVTAVSRQARPISPWSAKAFQSGMRHSIHCEGRSERFDVENVGGVGIRGSRGGRQEPLRMQAWT
jgi:hypothetical protein